MSKRVLSFLLLSVLATACAKKGAPVPAIAAPASPQAAMTAEAPPAAANSLAGYWVGNSGPDLPISFTVQNNQVTDLNASYMGQKDSCSFNGNLGSNAPAVISAKSFTSKGKSEDGSREFTATGTFTSMTEASGSLVWKGKSELCGDFEIPYKWTAKKSAEPSDE